jgi:hypothetical protein
MTVDLGPSIYLPPPRLAGRCNRQTGSSSSSSSSYYYYYYDTNNESTVDYRELCSGKSSREAAVSKIDLDAPATARWDKPNTTNIWNGGSKDFETTSSGRAGLSLSHCLQRRRRRRFSKVISPLRSIGSRTG